MRTKLFSALVVLVVAAVIAPGLQAQTTTRTSTSYSIHTPSRKYDFALVTGQNNVCCWGNWDSSVFKDLMARSKEETIYVKKDGDMFAITDRGVIAAAKKAIEPMERLGKQQGELGRQQGELGKEQGKLGRQQGEYGRQMGQLARDQEGKGRMEELSRKMQDLGKQQAALGEKQSKLGERQSELGKQQSQACKEAEEKLTKLIDDAFARGLARKG